MSGASRNGSSRADRPHVVVICVDALRADCLRVAPGSIWEDIGRPRTPVLDDLSAASRRWPRMIASSSWTKPAVPSIFVSAHPSEHGVLEVEKRRSGAWSPDLPEERATLAEVLRGAGYRTLGLAQNAQLDPRLGFGRGFDEYTCEAGSGDDIADRVLATRPFDGGRPVFLYVHLLEPHWPYGSRIAQRAEEIAEGRFAFHHLRASEWKRLKAALKTADVVPEATEIRFLRAAYGLAVEDADRAVGRVLAAVGRFVSLEDCLVVVLADHGEELLDHGSVGHGQTLHEELIRVPLMMRMGERVRANGFAVGQDEGVASHVDLLPTLAACAGAAYRSTAGRDLLQEPAPAWVFAEVKHKRRYEQAITDGRWKLVRQYRFARGDSAESRSDYNDLPRLFADRPYRVERRLHDLATDPFERADLALEEPETAARLATHLDTWQARLPRRGVDARQIEADMIRRLEALGYL